MTRSLIPTAVVLIGSAKRRQSHRTVARTERLRAAATNLTKLQNGRSENICADAKLILFGLLVTLKCNGSSAEKGACYVVAVFYKNHPDDWSLGPADIFCMRRKNTIHNRDVYCRKLTSIICWLCFTGCYGRTKPGRSARARWVCMPFTACELACRIKIACPSIPSLTVKGKVAVLFV